MDARTTVNAELVDKCRQKQEDYATEDMHRAFAEMCSRDIEDDWNREERGEEHLDDEDWPQQRSLPLSTLYKLRSQGKETPSEFTHRRAIEAEQRMNQRITREEEKERKKEQQELPVVAKPTVEFRIMLQQARNAQRFTQEQLAQKCGVKKTVVAEWESGKTVVPNEKMKMLKRILKI